MRSLKDTREDITELLKEYKQCSKGLSKARFVLCNAFKMYWILLEINEVLENEERDISVNKRI